MIFHLDQINVWNRNDDKLTCNSVICRQLEKKGYREIQDQTNNKQFPMKM